MQETQETQDQYLSQEGPLEEEMATYSSILAWKILWTEESGGLQSIGLQRVRQDWAHKKPFQGIESPNSIITCLVFLVTL